MSCGSKTFRKLFTWKYLLSKFSILDVVLILGSIGIYIFDLSTDVLNAVQYVGRGDEYQYVYFWASISFIIGPSLIIQITSLVWAIETRKDVDNINDNTDGIKYISFKNKTCYSILVFLVHLLQLSPLLRYIRTLFYGIKSRNEDYDEEVRGYYDKQSKYELQDVGVLRIFEAFLEAAPQLVLQISIMIRTGITPWITIISCVFGLLGITTAMVALQRAIRFADDNLKDLPLFPSSACMFLWRICTVMARVLSLSLLVTTNWRYFTAIITVHLWFWWFLISLKQNALCDVSRSKANEFFANLVCGIVYIFCYFNVHADNKKKLSSKTRMIMYYAMTFCENLSCTLLWFYYRIKNTELSTVTNDNIGMTALPTTTTTKEFVIKDDVSLMLVILVNSVYLLGIFFMFIYYKCFHPNVYSGSNCFSSHNNSTYNVNCSNNGLDSNQDNSHYGSGQSVAPLYIDMKETVL